MNRILIIGLAFFFFSHSAQGVTLPKIFGDNMVLQQNDSVHFWGWASGWRTKLLVTTSWGVSDTIQINSEGKWNSKIKTPKGSFEKQTVIFQELTIGQGGTITLKEGVNTKIEFKNVLIGEVWLCSGQSNMQMNSSEIEGSEIEIPRANYPNIRFFSIENRISEYPQDDIGGGVWKVCTPETMRQFSAVGYFFGLGIYRKLNVPVGLITDAWGGTPIEAHYSAESLKDKPLLYESSKKRGDTWDGAPRRLATVYNAMTYPLKDYSIAGMLWYQGESNVNADPELYALKLENLVIERRKQFGAGMPFYYVQIAPFKYKFENSTVIIRDQQRIAADKIKNSGMIVISDIGDTTNIHPNQKIQVGERLANVALKYHYQVIDGLVLSPMFEKAYTDGKDVWVEFLHAEGIHFNDGGTDHFEVSGADGKFEKVKAEVVNAKVKLDVGHIVNPKKVRFAWRNTATPFLLNGAGLPASCFGEQVITKVM